MKAGCVEAGCVEASCVASCVKGKYHIERAVIL